MQQFMVLQQQQMKQMLQLQQQQQAIQQPIKVGANSTMFAKFITFLAHLKQTALPSQPCICMECWLIITSAEIPYHRQQHPKQVTPSFQDMKMASKSDITDLCQKHKKFNNNLYELFLLSPEFKIVAQSLKQWQDGTINYYQQQASDEKKPGKII